MYALFKELATKHPNTLIAYPLQAMCAAEIVAKLTGREVDRYVYLQLDTGKFPSVSLVAIAFGA